MTCSQHKLRILENFEHLLIKMDSLGYYAATGIETVSKIKAVFESKLKMLELTLENFAEKKSTIFEAVELLN